MSTTTNTSESGDEGNQGVMVSGIDLSEYLRNQHSTSSYTPMGNFLEGPGLGRMEKLIESASPPPNTAVRQVKKARNRTKGSMAVEVPTSERSFSSK